MQIFLFIFLLLLIGYMVLIEVYKKAWKTIPEYVIDCTPSTTISVIISVRNEENNIEPLLHSISLQHYPRHLFEVIIVDDHSTDQTWAKLQQQISLYDYKLSTYQLAFFLSSSGEGSAFKKKAIETGIRLASGELIVTTDADCLFPSGWLLTIAGFFESKHAKMIAAPVRIRNEGSLLAIFQTLDFIALQGITGAAVSRRLHTLCNGANLAYEKKTFEEVNGFAGIDNIPSGDDMLLMHKIYQKYPDKIFYLKSKEAVVTTGPAKSWKEFFNQRIRWASKAGHYDDKKVFRVLLLVYLVNSCFLILAIASPWNTTWLFFLILLLIAKTVIEFPFINFLAAFFNQQQLMKYFPLLQPMHIIYTVIAGLVGKFGAYTWKGRVVKNKS